MARRESECKDSRNSINLVAQFVGNPTRDILDQLKVFLKKADLSDIRFHGVRRFGDCKIALKGQKVRTNTF